MFLKQKIWELLYLLDCEIGKILTRKHICSNLQVFELYPCIYEVVDIDIAFPSCITFTIDYFRLRPVLGNETKSPLIRSSEKVFSQHFLGLQYWKMTQELVRMKNQLTLEELMTFF